MNDTNLSNNDFKKVLDEVLDRILLTEFDNDIYYSKNYLCLKETDENIFITGFNSLIRNFLSFINSIVLIPVNEIIEDGKPFGWIIQGGKTFSIYSPIKAMIVEHNKKLIETPDNLRNKKFPENWFIKLQPDNRLDCLKKLMSGKVAKEWFEKENQKFKDEIIKILTESHPTELITRYDGGKFVHSIAEILPQNEYLRILKNMIFK